MFPEPFAGACLTGARSTAKRPTDLTYTHNSWSLTHPSALSLVYSNTFMTVTQRKRKERMMWATQQCSAHLLNDKQNNATVTTNLTHADQGHGKK